MMLLPVGGGQMRTGRRRGKLSFTVSFLALILRTAASLLSFVQVRRFHVADRAADRASSPHPSGVRNSVLGEAPELNPGHEGLLQPDLAVALDRFVSQVDAFNEECRQRGRQRQRQRQPPPMQIVSRGSDSLPPHLPTQTTVFVQAESGRVVAVISSASDGGGRRVDPSKVRSLLPDDDGGGPLVPLPSDEVASVCGFPLETLPPIWQRPTADRGGPSAVVLDESLLKTCQAGNLMFLCGAGYPYWRSLVDPEAMLYLPSLLVADVLVGEEEEEDNGDAKRSSDDAAPSPPRGSFVCEVTSGPPLAHAAADESFSPDAETADGLLFPVRPYFPGDVPPMHLARVLVRQREISNPLLPSFVSLVGRIGRIRRRTKRALSCELCPPPALSRNERKDWDWDRTLPWRSARDGRNMEVELSIGKATKRGEILIETIEEEQILQIEARTIPGQRESLSKWVEKRCLDLELIDYRILVPGGASPGNGRSLDRDKEDIEISNMDSRPSPSRVHSHLPSMTLNDAFNSTIGDAANIVLVDSLEMIESFSCDFSSLLLLSQQSDEKTKSLSGCSVGIDCEWQPTVFMESSSKRQTSQPVLLLQISLNALEKVYLFDLQTLLRPLRQPHKPMNEIEQAVSDCLRPVMKSENVLKVGYQIPSDLRRIAASYPHLPCFREVRSVLEIASLIKRVLHVSKQKRSRYITTSLDSMTSHYLGRTLDKGKQMSNWAARPLSAEQLEYASLDAAVSPVLADRALRSIGASICNITSECVGLDDNESGGNSGPVIERWHGDVGLSKEIVSWRFQFLGEADESTVSRLQAKQVVGSSWIASKSWISGQKCASQLC